MAAHLDIAPRSWRLARCRGRRYPRGTPGEAAAPACPSRRMTGRRGLRGRLDRRCASCSDGSALTTARQFPPTRMRALSWRGGHESGQGRWRSDVADLGTGHRPRPAPSEAGPTGAAGERRSPAGFVGGAATAAARPTTSRWWPSWVCPPTASRSPGRGSSPQPAGRSRRRRPRYRSARLLRVIAARQLRVRAMRRGSASSTSTSPPSGATPRTARGGSATSCDRTRSTRACSHRPGAGPRRDRDAPRVAGRSTLVDEAVSSTSGRDRHGARTGGRRCRWP
jgi:hypothetical protein